MKWSAKIDDKSNLTQDGMLTYTFSIFGDDVLICHNVVLTGKPDQIQSLVCARVTEFAQAYELSQSLPSVGDFIEVIQ